ncbi:2'-5' RNA ligase family protein [Myxococcota bacterium]|nr:2'-5' RNA ligase family protein [Myxococcota bacterium]
MSLLYTALAAAGARRYGGAMPTPTDALFEAFAAPGSTWGPTPGVRAEWAKGRRRYAVWLLRVDTPALRARLAQVADALGDAVEVTPPGEAHITLWVAGFPSAAPCLDDDVAEVVLTRQTQALRTRFASAGPARIVIGGANAFFTCAVLDVLDQDGSLEAIRACLDGEGKELRFGPYHPHVTVGRFIDHRDRAPLAAALRPLRALAPMELQVESVELCTIDAEVEALALHTEARVQLTGPRR